MAIIKYLPHYVKSEKTLKYSSTYSACADLTASISEPYFLFPSKRVKIPTGVCISGIKDKEWYRINGRSGLATNNGIIPIGGIIDSDYTGEVFVTLLNTSSIIPRYIGIYNKCTVIVNKNGLKFIYDKYEKECNDSNIFVNCMNESLNLIIDNCNVEIPAGNAFKIVKGSVQSYEYAYKINPGDAIAQLEAIPLYQTTFKTCDDKEWADIEKLSQRKSNGFGSSGK